MVLIISIQPQAVFDSIQTPPVGLTLFNRLKIFKDTVNMNQLCYGKDESSKWAYMVFNKSFEAKLSLTWLKIKSQRAKNEDSILYCVFGQL